MPHLWNRHPEAEGQHATLSASTYGWLRYTDERFDSYIEKKFAAGFGTELHNYAAMAIKLKIMQARTRQTLNMYINDAVRFGMSPEKVLFFSWNCFGTADAIGFRREKVPGTDSWAWVLRIHDLKTGTSRASFDQLCIYAALFCLEYKQDPFKILIELRIYQNDEMSMREPEAEYIKKIMDLIQRFDNRLTAKRLEAMV